MNERIIVVPIVQKGEYVLLGKKASGPAAYVGPWVIPGGGIEDYERGKKLVLEKKYLDTYFKGELLRELGEEARGLKIKTDTIRCTPALAKGILREDTRIKDGKETHMIFLEYLCDYESGEATPGDDMGQLAWFKKSELKTLQLMELTTKLFKELGWI